MLRSALLEAGNIVKLVQVDAVLIYVTADGQYPQLDGLHLALLRDDTIERLKWLGGFQHFGDDLQYLPPQLESAAAMVSALSRREPQLISPSDVWQELSM